MRPLISLVINVRNGADDLSKCLRSLRDFAVEIIVVDMLYRRQCLNCSNSWGQRYFPFVHMKHVDRLETLPFPQATRPMDKYSLVDEYLFKTLKRELKRITARTDIDFVRIPRRI